MELELGLDPDDAARVARLAILGPLKRGKPRRRLLRATWHDSPDHALACQGLALVEQRPQWRLERLLPDGLWWPPGAPAPVLATGRNVAALGQPLPETLAPIAALEGRTVTQGLATKHGQVSLTLLTGTIRGFAAEQRVCRLSLDGSRDAIQPLAMALANEIRLSVPCASLAGLAAAVASSAELPPRHEGAPELPPGLSVAAAFGHVVGHLADVILYLAPKAAQGSEGPEPVHQMRVAVRRLRSAIKVFGRAIDAPEVVSATTGLKTLAATLAPTRDWDVFMTEAAPEIAGAVPSEPRLRRLFASAERRRQGCHDELRRFLDGAEFRRLGIELACLVASPTGNPGQAGPDPTLETFAGEVLRKRLKRLFAIDKEIVELEPAALHAIRLRAKRLRYAAEIFAPLFPAKPTHRFVRRLSRLQDRLGTLNDGAVAAHLLGEFASRHAFATGLVVGFLGARNRSARAEIDKAWRKFRRAEPFWE
jgi:CHAD domain-containing protein